jgi:hypothetical protein
MDVYIWQSAGVNKQITNYRLCDSFVEEVEPIITVITVVSVQSETPWIKSCKGFSDKVFEFGTGFWSGCFANDAWIRLFSDVAVWIEISGWEVPQTLLFVLSLWKNIFYMST